MFVYIGALCAAFPPELGIKTGWMRGMIYANIIDPHRDSVNGWYCFDFGDVCNLVVAKKMRRAGISLDTVREITDRMFFDGEDLVSVLKEEAIVITVDKAKIIPVATKALSLAATKFSRGRPLREAAGVPA